MNTKLIAFIIIGIAAAAGGYLLMGNNEPEPIPGTIEEIKTESKRGALSDFLDGKSLYCTFLSEEGGMQSEGEFWHANGQYRIESVSQLEGGVYETYVINDGSELYVWSDTPDGLMAVHMSASEDEGVNEMSDTAEMSPDVDEEVSYECNDWTPDNSRFVPPTDIEFMNFDTLLEDLPALPEDFDPNNLPVSI